MRPIFLLALVCLAAMSELVLARVSHLDEWRQYKRQYGKVYEKRAEDAHRFALFLAAKERVAQLNSAKAAASHRSGLNHLSDWTDEEFAQLNGIRYERAAHERRLQSSRDNPFLRAILDDPAPVPDEVDWRKVPGRVSPVKNQGHCGSCWAFATTGTLEGQQVVRNFSSMLVPLSEQDLVDCSTSNNGCQGGIMEAALDDIKSMGGIESEKDYPYVAPNDSKCRFGINKVVMTDAGAADLPIYDEEAMKKVVAKFGPVSIALFVNDAFRHYTGGIFDDHGCVGQVNHGVLVVGYGTDPQHGDYWIVKNSWSRQWGEDGYIRIKRGVRMCEISRLATIPVF